MIPRLASRFSVGLGVVALSLGVVAACASDGSSVEGNPGGASSGGSAGAATMMAGTGSSGTGQGGSGVGGGAAGVGGSVAGGGTLDGGDPPPDGGTPDAGSPMPDGGTPDAGTPEPDGGAPDGGVPQPDAGMPDAGADGGPGDAGLGDGGLPDPAWCQVGPVPADLREDWDVEPYYQKYADANGIPILCSNAPPDEAIVLACRLVIEMVSKRDDVRLALIDNHVHFTVIGVDEQTNDVPEYAYLDDSINTRARGLGGNPGMCAEESILCGPTDRWRGESICVHEFAHTISLYGLYDADPTFEDRLIEAFESAESAGRFADTYAMENEQEYWGEGVQDWYYTNLESQTPNGVHGPIDTREELSSYDPALYALIGELLGEDVSWADCYRKTP